MDSFSFVPIGFVHGGGKYPAEAPRQAAMAHNTGTIELLPGRGFETALTGLAGFEMIWVIFVFDRNPDWKPMVRPPETPDGRKVGVFACRAPYRPNPVGISAVKLRGVKNRTLQIADFDLLDGTPVLDIKPYIPAADAFPHVSAGWRDEVAEIHRRVEFSAAARARIDFVRDSGGPDLSNVIHTQLGTRSPDPARQRLTELEGGGAILAWRTWRIVFRRDADDAVMVTEIFSGYTPEELAAPEDPYADKELHRIFSEFLKRM